MRERGRGGEKEVVELMVFFWPGMRIIIDNMTKLELKAVAQRYGQSNRRQWRRFSPGAG